MATVMLERGADIRFIQQMLGHARLYTTQIYTQVSIRSLCAVHAATHPTAKIMGAAATSGAVAPELPPLVASPPASRLEDELAEDDGDEDDA